MKIPNNKLFSILSHFSKIESNRFRKYLHSPYFNRNEDLVNLFAIIEKILFSKSEAPFDKQKVWSKLFKGQRYDDGKLRKLFSDLLKLVEGFIAQEIYSENPIHEATFLIEAVGRKKLEKLYNSTMSTARRISDRQIHRSSQFYFHQYQIERNYYDLTGFDLNRSSVTNVEDIINNLDYFYLAEKLKYYCETLSRKNVVSHEYELLFIDEIVEHINKYKYEDVPPIAVYFQMYLTHVDSEDESHYFKLKDLLEKYGHIFPKNEAQAIYTNAINYCIKRLNLGSQKFLEEFLIINESLLSKKILDEGELSPWKFRNIVVASLRLGKFDWTEEFINTYQSYIAEGFRENAVTFNMAQFYFYKKDYEKVISLLQEVEYEDFTYNLNSKTFLLTTYYETDEIEALYSLSDSFRTYLNRNKKIANFRRKAYLDLIKFIKKLSKIMSYDKKSLEKLKKEINETTTEITSRKWLLEKLEEKMG